VRAASLTTELPARSSASPSFTPPPPLRAAALASCSHVVRPNSLEGSIDVMLFREGIKPMWEDDANKRGGKISIKLRKGLATHLWEELVLALVGEQFEDSVIRDVCGAVLSVRYHDDTISLWVRNAEDEAAIARLRCVASRGAGGSGSSGSGGKRAMRVVG
jgi:hypothetical protein